MSFVESNDEVITWFYTKDKLPRSIRLVLGARHLPDASEEIINIVLWGEKFFFTLLGLQIEVYAWAELPDTPPYEVEDNG